MSRIKIEEVKTISIPAEDYQNYLHWRNEKKKQEAFKELLHLWQDFVQINVCKERDFEFSLLTHFDFWKNKINIRAKHKGYIVDFSISKEYPTVQQAISECIFKNFKQIEPWCKEVLKDPDEYEYEQVEQAQFYFSNKNRLAKLHQVLYNKIK